MKQFHVVGRAGKEGHFILETVQIQHGKSRLLRLFHQEGAAFQREFDEFVILFFGQTAAFIAVFILRIRVGQEDFGRCLLNNGRENRAVNRIFRRLRNQNQPAAAFAVGFQAFKHDVLQGWETCRPPKLFHNRYQETVFFCDFVQHDIAKVEHISQHRCGRRIVVLQNIGQVEADTVELLGVKQVRRIVQTPREAAVFAAAPFRQPDTE